MQTKLYISIPRYRYVNQDILKHALNLAHSHFTVCLLDSSPNSLTHERCFMLSILLN